MDRHIKHFIVISGLAIAPLLIPLVTLAETNDSIVKKASTIRYEETHLSKNGNPAVFIHFQGVEEPPQISVITSHPIMVAENKGWTNKENVAMVEFECDVHLPHKQPQGVALLSVDLPLAHNAKLVLDCSSASKNNKSPTVIQHLSLSSDHATY